MSLSGIHDFGQLKLMDLQQLVIFYKQVLRQAQHERNINVLREFPFGLSPSTSSGEPCRRAVVASSSKLDSRPEALRE
jgi:hypothetical protein